MRELSPTTRLVPSAFHPTRALRSLRRPRHSFHLLLRHPYFLFAPSRAHSSPPSYPALNTTSRHLFLASPSAALRPSSRCVHRRPKMNASGAAPRAAARASSISAAATRSATSPPLTTQRKVERQHSSRHHSLKDVEGSANWRRPMSYRHSPLRNATSHTPCTPTRSQRHHCYTVLCSTRPHVPGRT